MNELDANDKIVRLIIGMEEAPDTLITLRRNSEGVVGNVASRDFGSRELVRFLGGGHWQFEGNSDTAFLVEQPEQKRSVINSDSVKGVLKKLLKWIWGLMWYLILFHL